MCAVDAAEHARSLVAQARAADERRLLVLAGDRTAGLDAARRACAAADLAPVVVTDRDLPWGETFAPAATDSLLGTTRPAVVLDVRAGTTPNDLGRAVGAVDGGGLLVLVAPSLAAWPGTTTPFDESLAVPPATAADAGDRFRRHLVRTLEHPGVSVLDVDDDRLRRDGHTEAEAGAGARAGAGPVPPNEPPPVPAGAVFPDATYEACLTADQARAVRALEGLVTDDGDRRAVVVEADRGRGKSAAAGVAAAALAADGADVLVTAPDPAGTDELFARARALLDVLDARAGPAADDGVARDLRTTAGGRIRYEPPAAAGRAGDADAVIADEAAGLPVRRLAGLLDAPAVAFVTTVHGYEGAGQGFAVRFRDRLDEAPHAVTDVVLREPIRYARDDPVESWAFRALLLDARPAVAPAVADATPDSVRYVRPSADDLLADRTRLRETIGLLARAHYRTEPDDLARLLDAPNLAVRTLERDGRVVSVALLAREGGLSPERRRAIYRGERVRGHVLPDALTSQLRDVGAGAPVGHRVLRIATHEAVRSRGLGGRLLDAVADEFGARTDWLGVAFGATPRLLRFWTANGFRTVHLSTTRNERSGEYSALMLRPTSAAGRALAARHARRFRDRAAGVLADPLCDADPDVVRLTLRAVDAPVDPDLSAHEWRAVAAAAHGPGLYVTAPGAAARLAVAALVADVGLDARAERLLVRKLLQTRPWSDVVENGDYVSERAAMRALGAALRPAVERFGGAAARDETARHAGGG